MVVVHDTKESLYSLKIDYEPLIGKHWSHSLAHLLKAPEMSKLMIDLNNQSKKMTIYPTRSNIFKPFKLTSRGDVRVILLDCNPKFNEKSNGLAFGNTDNTRGDFSPLLIGLQQDIEFYIKDGLFLDFDYTLERWAKSGILMLNRYLTSAYKEPHKDWEFFTKGVIKYLSDNSFGLIFALVGDKDNTYSKLINTDLHNVLFSENLDYKLLKSINDEIEYINGKSETIDW